MGSLQEHWFYNQLNYSSEREATWRIIGQQIVFSRLNESLLYGEALPLDFDAWDGYQSARVCPENAT
jgi:alkaline phosphatase D